MKKIFPSTYFMIFLVLIIALHYILPIFQIIYFPYRWLGIALVIFGIIMNLWADNIFKIKKTTVKPDQVPSFLIMEGPFRISRHPMYLGMAAILLGAAVFFGSLITFLVPLVFIVLVQMKFIAMEEQKMKNVFGQKYIDYQKRVRCWI